MEKKKKKPIGYTASDRKSMKQLIERTQPNVGDYVGSGTVTVKKPAKKMAGGGRAGYGGKNDPAGPRGMGGAKGTGARGPTGPRGESRASPAFKGGSKTVGPSNKGVGGLYKADMSKSFGRNWAGNTMTGRALSGGLRALGVKGFKAGGIVGKPARSYKDMKAGAGSGVGRIQKTKIARGR